MHVVGVYFACMREMVYARTEGVICGPIVARNIASILILLLTFTIAPALTPEVPESLALTPQLPGSFSRSNHSNKPTLKKHHSYDEP